MNGRPLSPRKTVQILVLLTLLAWATQTLLHQWARGQDIPEPPQPTELAAGPDASPEQAGPTKRLPVGPRWSDAQPDPEQGKFQQGTLRFFAGATLEMRSEATIVGTEIRLRQLCRWTEADKSAFDPVADLVLTRVSANTPFRSVTIEEVKQMLHDAGVNLAVIRFAGATSCTVSRGDVPYDEHTALQQWIDAKTTPPATEASAPAAVAAGAPLAPAPLGNLRPEAQPARFSPSPALEPAKAPVDEANPLHTLRDLLVKDLAERLSVPVESLQVRFNPTDDKVLNLSEPQFRFNVDGRRAKNLGDVVWEVTIVSSGAAKKIVVIADARAWQTQVLTARPLAYKQIIRDEDLMDRRVLLVDRLGDETPCTRPQLVGQMAGRELKAGTIMTPRLVEAVPLVQSGQLVSITAQQGSVQIRTAARAMEPGSFGQTVRVRNETTRDIYEIILTGPQEGRMIGNTSVGAALDAAPLEHN